ncbi:MAG: hypothetical protein EOO63_13545, partial [Hymenobacter sp.]
VPAALAARPYACLMVRSKLRVTAALLAADVPAASTMGRTATASLVAVTPCSAFTLMVRSGSAPSVACSSSYQPDGRHWLKSAGRTRTASE